MTDKELNKVRQQVREYRNRTSFPAPPEGDDNGARADRHAEYGAARH